MDLNKKKLYPWALACIILASMLTLALGATSEPRVTSAKIGKQELKGQTQMTLKKDNLNSHGEVVIEGKADGGGSSVKKIEVSVDGGQTWDEAKGKETWQHRFSPVPNKNYYFSARVTNTAGLISDPRAFGVIKLTYLPYTLSELIQKKADELSRAYMAKDLDRYMKLVSREYQNIPRGRHKLRQSIDNDFKSLNNIVLRFTVNQVFELEGVIMAEIYWRLTYAGLQEPREGYIEIHFDPLDQLKILVQKKDLYFGAMAIGYNATIRLQHAFFNDNVIVALTDLDKIGARRVTVAVRITGTYANNSGNMTLNENPPRSGRFGGRRLGTATAGETFTATYLDEITTSWRRNIRRSATYVNP